MIWLFNRSGIAHLFVIPAALLFLFGYEKGVGFESGKIRPFPGIPAGPRRKSCKGEHGI